MTEVKEKVSRVSIEYQPGPNPTEDRKLRELCKKFRGKEVGSGLLLLDRTRDMQFEFKLKADAEAFYKAIAKMGYDDGKKKDN